MRILSGGFLVEIVGVVRIIWPIESYFAATAVKKDCVVIVRKAGECQTFCQRAMPDDFALEIIFSQNLVEHDFDVVAGVPVAVVIKAAGLFEDAGELHAARAHVVNVGAGGFVAVFKGAFLLGLAPKDFVVAVGVEGRVNVNQIHAGVGQLGELFQIVAAVNDAGVEEGGRFG